MSSPMSWRNQQPAQTSPMKHMKNSLVKIALIVVKYHVLRTMLPLSTHQIQEKTINQKLKLIWKTVSKFLSENSLAVNEDKTTVTEIMIQQKHTRITGIPPMLYAKDKDGNYKCLKAGKYTRILGGNISNNLTWTHHLETGEHAILSKLHKQIGALNLLAKHIPKSSRLLLANGLIMSRVCYLIQVWGCAPQSQLKKIQIILNSAAQFVTGWHKCTATIALMKACNWLYVKELCSLQSLVSMWNTLHHNIPMQLRDSLQTDEEMIVTTSPPRLITVAHSYKWRTVGIWNQLEKDTRMLLSLPKFKKSVNKWLCDQCEIEPDWKLPNQNNTQ